MFVNKIYFNDIVNAKLICIINTYISLSMSNGKLLKKKNTCELQPTLLCYNVLVIVLTCESLF